MLRVPNQVVKELVAFVPESRTAFERILRSLRPGLFTDLQDIKV